jgi:hypothetical protein
VIGFLSPLFLAGAAAVAIPIAIHLFYRRTEPVVDFAATRYLRRAPVEQAQRRRLRELLLLALRVAALILLALAFARPYISQSAAALAARGTMVLIDTSVSMSGPGQFERARALADQIVRNAAAGDVVGVMSFGAGTTSWRRCRPIGRVPARPSRASRWTPVLLDTAPLLPEQRRNLVTGQGASSSSAIYSRRVGTAPIRADFRIG